MKTLLAPLFACLLVACATSEAPPTGDGDGDGDGDVDAGNSDGSSEICAKDPCDLYDQCGCDAPQVCDLDFTDLDNGSTACRDVTSPGTETSACGNFDTEACAGGYLCLGSGGSQCRKYCQDDADCNGLGSCLIEPSTANGPIPGVKTCTKTCDPVSASPTACPATFGCGVFTIGTDAVTDCRPAVAANTDEVDCTNAQCAPGFTCVAFTIGGVPDRTVCKQTCTYPGGACNTGTCDTLGSTPVNGVEYGACI